MTEIPRGLWAMCTPAGGSAGDEKYSAQEWQRISVEISERYRKERNR